MNDTIRSILSRVLSQEIAHQEVWQYREHQKYGCQLLDREAIITEIKNFMEQEGIEFREDFYLQER